MNMRLAEIACQTESVLLFVANFQKIRLGRPEKNGGARELAKIWYYFNERKSATMRD